MFYTTGIKNVLDREFWGVVFLELCEDVSIAENDAGGRGHCLTERRRRCLQDFFGGQTASDQCEI